jgi:phosphoribosylformimino-5-aminoimidazole carboxamide ribotide isomerase
MIIYPAIDVSQGACVRLYQGDFHQKTTYSCNPNTMLDTFVNEGADWLHLVDLDGAKNPKNNQKDLMLTLLKQQRVSVQIGGGVRCADTIETYLEAGAARVIIGSMAVLDPETVLSWFQRFGADHLVLALDVVYDATQQAFVATHAWKATSRLTPADLMDTYMTVGLKHILCTDISKDGTLQGPNIALYEAILSQYPTLHIQASGGVHALSDLVLLREAGCDGAIVGRALYEHKFCLSEALSC